MGRLKIYAGISLLIQTISFLAILLFAASSKRKRAVVFGMLAAGFGVAGAYLVLKGVKESAPVLEFEDEDDDFLEDELDCIECSILSDCEAEGSVLELG